MVFNVQEFANQIKSTGVLQTNKFEVEIFFGSQSMMGSFISSLSGGTVTFSQIASDLRYRCIEAKLPGIVLQSTEVNRFGLGIKEKMPISGRYTDIELTFLVDRDSNVYSFFYAWLNFAFSIVGEETENIVDSISPNRSFYTAAYKDEYAAIIVITIYDNVGNPSMMVALNKAFPVAINDEKVAWGDNNNLLKLTAIITFREWELTGASTTGTQPPISSTF